MHTFEARSLRDIPIGPALGRIIAAALAAVEPGHAVRQTLHALETRSAPIRLLAVGKASVPMAEAALAILGQQVRDGLIVTKQGTVPATMVTDPRVTLIEAGHPIADAQSLRAGETIARYLASTLADDLVLVLLSGGGSALMTLPVDGVTLADMQMLNQLLLACGAPITAINTVRKHLDRVKGGGLARMAYPAAVNTLILSDVIGNQLEVIASGPTVADPSTYQDALAVLQQYGLTAQVPTAIRRYLEAGDQGQRPETLKPGDSVFARCGTEIIGDISLAVSAAHEQAQQEGFHSLILTTRLVGEAREVGHVLAAIAKEMALTGNPVPRPAWLIIGGETTVTVRGPGQGGRNQELALAMVQNIAGLERIAVLTLATDGGDGPTDAAGAVVTGETWSRAKQLGLDPAEYLSQNNSYPFFAALEDSIRTGPTQTNVNDLLVIVTW